MAIFAADDMRVKSIVRSEVLDIAKVGCADGPHRALVGGARPSIIIACVSAEDHIPVLFFFTLGDIQETATVEIFRWLSSGGIDKCCEQID